MHRSFSELTGNWHGFESWTQIPIKLLDLHQRHVTETQHHAYRINIKCHEVELVRRVETDQLTLATVTDQKAKNVTWLTDER